MNDAVTINGTTKLTSTFESTNVTDNTLGNVDTGAVQIDGGVGIAKNVTVGAGLSVGQGLTVIGVTTSAGLMRVTNTTTNTIGDATTGALTVAGGVGISSNLTVGGATSITGNVHITGNITVEGTGLFPIGSIIIWYGAVVDIPTGWSLCNGQTVGAVTTPDLRERFVVGAGGDNSNVVGTSGYTVDGTGGVNVVTLTTDQIPSHTHSLSDPGHNHSFNGSNGPDNEAAGGNPVPAGGGNFNGTTGNRTTGITIAATGGGSSHENRPPFYALCYIMRTS